MVRVQVLSFVLLLLFIASVSCRPTEENAHTGLFAGKDGSSSAAASKPQVVKLNIGGTRYWTTRETLLSSGSPFFKSLLGDTNSVGYDDKGFIFIDNEGRNFRVLLDYLRSKKIQQETSQVLLEEAKLYQVPLGDIFAFTLVEFYLESREKGYQQFVADHRTKMDRIFDKAVLDFLSLADRPVVLSSSSYRIYVAKNAASVYNLTQTQGVDEKFIMMDAEITDWLCTFAYLPGTTNQENFERFYLEKGLIGFDMSNNACGLSASWVALSLLLPAPLYPPAERVKL